MVEVVKEVVTASQDLDTLWFLAIKEKYAKHLLK